MELRKSLTNLLEIPFNTSSRKQSDSSIKTRSPKNSKDVTPSATPRASKNDIYFYKDEEDRKRKSIVFKKVRNSVLKQATSNYMLKNVMDSDSVISFLNG